MKVVLILIVILLGLKEYQPYRIKEIKPFNSLTFISKCCNIFYPPISELLHCLISFNTAL